MSNELRSNKGAQEERKCLQSLGRIRGRRREPLDADLSVSGIALNVDSLGRSVHAGEIHLVVDHCNPHEPVVFPNAVSSKLGGVGRQVGNLGVLARADSFVNHGCSVVHGPDLGSSGRVGTLDRDRLNQVVTVL